MKSLFKADLGRCPLSFRHPRKPSHFQRLIISIKKQQNGCHTLSCGAHISHDYTGLAGNILGLDNINHVYNIDEFNIDPDKSAYVIRAAKPGIVTFGGSLFLFPHPIKELRAVCEEVGAYIAYDASHVLGLIAGGQFQDPLREGADFITSFNPQNFPRSTRRRHHGKPNTTQQWRKPSKKSNLQFSH